MNYRFLKRILSMALAIVMIFNSEYMTLNSYAKEIHGEYADVCRDDVPIRTGPSKDAEIVTTCCEGTVLKLEGGICNNHNNSWYIVNVDSEECYVYSGNLEEHECHFHTMTYNGTEYSYCNCGKINVIDTQVISINRAESIAIYAGDAAMAAALDGPTIPIGDLVGVMILIFGAADSVLNGVSEEVVEVIREVDLDDLLEEETQCTDYNFRKVGYDKGIGKLYYLDDECLDALQAYFYTLFVGNTYTKYEATAKSLASLWGECFPERDKDRPDYWYHYHFGNKDSRLGFHVFYGTNDYGEYPTQMY